MKTEQVHLTAEKETLLPTLYGKALDSRAANSILGDKFADEVVRRLDYDFEKLNLPKGAAISCRCGPSTWMTGPGIPRRQPRARSCSTWAAVWTAGSVASTRRPRPLVRRRPGRGHRAAAALVSGRPGYR